MKCSHLHMAGGGVAIVCASSRRAPAHQCCGCGRMTATLQCDWKTGKGKTCDEWICAGCAQSVGPDKDLCPEHRRAWAVHPANQARF